MDSDNIVPVIPDTASFIKLAASVHKDKYDYSKAEYVNKTTKVCIICPVHREFWQAPADHLRGKGCRLCGTARRAAMRKPQKTSEFVEKARAVLSGLLSMES